jgi:molecular chaperone DnaJ
LSDPKKKEQYDRYGFVGDMGGFNQGGNPYGGFDFSNFQGAGFDFSDLFDAFGGGGSRRASYERGPKKGEDIQYSMKIGFKDAVHGFTTRIRVNRSNPCTRCGGSGKVPTNSPTVCGVCHGTGKVSGGSGFFSVQTTCSACGGRGQVSETNCPICSGTGRLPQSETIKVKIPAGVDNGSKVKVPGKGEAGRNGGPAGDLYIITVVEEDPFFKRKGDNIYVKIPITYSEGSLGAKVDDPTLYGKTTVKIPPGTTCGQKIRIREKGVKSLRTGTKGDMYLEIALKGPDITDAKARELLKELSKYEDKNIRNHLPFE